MQESITILIGNPANALYKIAASRASAKTPGDKILYPHFEILADKEIVHAGDIDRVTVVSTGLSDEEELLIMKGLAKYCGTTGASARKYLSEKGSVAMNAEKSINAVERAMGLPETTSEQRKEEWKKLMAANGDAILSACKEGPRPGDLGCD
ncbi:MAG: hypothetical protein US57_C0009G0006 [Candidatus Moranbacteria bacterium GW2011_GWC2_37_73]|nr:MAG: hypothetical protein UR95_C0005G0034 [Parcubacteria group bacterium GW2011_GWC1_36_108]KKQ00187.1 MAG: hypothetical protein US09_C0018G0017 [Candidatus Moranbacteria bacterium GW2011_GWD1_36_198]KKQ01320.1 MAG: hypothetical protein US10_C0018G0017 [Candidatus Moranbacteria bacterium GW2011_GWD2_36_198]KKQ39762.1 MAG: hypothetical protein US57_C0009G0006 [Candidatus Moranbacteria bacterium GW2011_GWC2_37_73]